MSAARRRRPWRQSIDGPFAPRRIEMLESPAYRVLSLSARRVLDRIEIELAHHGGNDNGKLPISYDDFERYGMDRHAIAPAIREAEALGFTEIMERGRAGNGEFRLASKYRLTYRHLDKAKPTDEWRRIQTMDDAEAIARAARRETKQSSSGGKRHVSVRTTPTENAPSPVWKTPTTVSVEKPPLLSISGVPVPGSSAALDPRASAPEGSAVASERGGRSGESVLRQDVSGGRRGRLKDRGVRQRVRDALKDGGAMSVVDLMAAARIRSRTAADGLLFKLRQAGDVERVGRGLYRARAPCATA